MKKIICIVLAVIIIVGIIITATIGLNVDIMYKSHDQVNIYIGKETRLEEIEPIVKEVFENKKVKIIAIESFNDAFAVNTENVSDEQIENLKQKVGEKFQIEDTSNTVAKAKIPKLKLSDLIKSYINPIAISTAIIILFMGIRFKKIGTIKVWIQSLIFICFAEALLLSIIAITRCPVNQYIIPAGLAVYLSTIIVLNIQNLKELDTIKISEKNK